MKSRLDQLLVDRGLAESRHRAQGLIRAGVVIVAEQRIDKPGRLVDSNAPLRIKGEYCPYVSRGGLKLAGALVRFGLTDLSGRQALDIGASTGGFTDCLLQHGAARVWAVDTGRGQLHSSLRGHPLLTLREQANARHLTPEWLQGQAVDLAVIDVSFISLRLIIPPLAAVLKHGGIIVALVKPQFEAGKKDVGSGGVVRDREVQRRVLLELTDFVRQEGWHVLDMCPSPLLGAAGNREFFLELCRQPPPRPALNPEQTQIAVEQILSEAYNIRE